jgi:hypothetical protein
VCLQRQRGLLSSASACFFLSASSVCIFDNLHVPNADATSQFAVPVRMWLG